jgi:hypothetical protein
LFVS